MESYDRQVEEQEKPARRDLGPPVWVKDHAASSYALFSAIPLTRTRLPAWAERNRLETGQWRSPPLLKVNGFGNNVGHRPDPIKARW